MEKQMISINRKKTIISLLYVFFFLSGMTGLMYEIIWIRKLSVIFGHTVFAMSSILSAFMGGLALGSYLAGKFADKMHTNENYKGIFSFLSHKSFSPYMKMYGILQLIIGVYGLTTPFFADLLRGLYVSIMSQFSLGLYPISIITFLLAMIVFLIPTVCMGATLPIILKFVINTYGEILTKTARMYSINTFGAVIGSFLAGFILFPAIGLYSTLLISSGISLLIGVTTIVVDRFFFKSPNQEQSELDQNDLNMEPVENAPENQMIETQEKIQKADETSNWIYPLVLIVLFLSGFTSMMYQVSWSRAISLSIGSSVYSYSTILTTFLLGIAIGSIILSNPRWFNQNRINILTLANIELYIGILGFLIIPFLGFLPYVFLRMFPFVESSYHTVIAGNFLICFLAIILPTTLIGMTFPLCIKIYTQKLERLGGSIGRVYASNAAGNILGSFMAGFVFIPLVGAEVTLKIAVALNLITASIIYIKTHASQRIRFVQILKFAVIILVFAGIFLVNFWEKSAMTMGVSVYARKYQNVKSLAEFNKQKDFLAKDIVFYKDGISCTVTVSKKNGEISLRVNGKTDASYSNSGIIPDMYTQWMLGFLPVVMHPSPSRVCVIGFGSGTTAAAASLFQDTEIIDSVEIEPVVMEAAKFFEEANMGVVHSPKFHSHIADGRNFILASREKYDVIISEPSNPWIAGIGNLFSKDFFRIAYDRLNEDGIFCQWIHTYTMEPEILQTVINTFYSEFPHGSIWCLPGSDIILIGTKKEYSLDYERLESVYYNNKKIHENMKKLGYDFPYQIAANFLTKADNARYFVIGSDFNTDDKPLLEFYAPLALYKNSNASGAINTLPLYEESNFDFFDNFDKKLLENPDFYHNLGLISQKVREIEGSNNFFKKALQLDDNHYKTHIALAINYLSMNNPIASKTHLDKAIKIEPHNSEAYNKLADLYTWMLSPEYALVYLREIQQKFPDNEQLSRKLIKLELQLNHPDNALKHSEHLMKLNPTDIDNNILFAESLIALDNYEEAEKIIKNLLDKTPENTKLLISLAEIKQKQNQLNEAGELLSYALRIDPNNVNTGLKLAEVYAWMNMYPEAIRVYRHVLSRDLFNPTARKGIYENFQKMNDEN
jgi:spermidine synthase